MGAWRSLQVETSWIPYLASRPTAAGGNNLLLLPSPSMSSSSLAAAAATAAAGGGEAPTGPAEVFARAAAALRRGLRRGLQLQGSSHWAAVAGEGAAVAAGAAGGKRAVALVTH